ncbi:endonuclease/exonuclease/phosphatase family protein, partial [Brevundimonas sp.]|uniref:endonuclease/exonuclease/phosphatase family protein n=1 Tax=Brevundimonas sp. TaxID=1871086 RepID=UPI0025E03397
MLRIATWNINSVRLRADQVVRFIEEQQPDVLMLQEIKCRTEEFPSSYFRDAGLPYLRVQGQKGWHGVAIASRRPIADGPA